MAERADEVRGRMREMWGARARSFAEHAAPQTSKYAEVLVGAVAPRPGERVLDVACGSGVVAVRAARLVEPAGEVVATDLAPEWAELVAETAAAAGVTNVAFRAMGAEALDLPDQAFDAAFCQFGLMFVPDPTQALREMRRVLRDGGRLGIIVWSTGDRVACFGMDRILSQLAPPPPDMPTPHALAEPGLIERLVADAGFGAVRLEDVTIDSVIEDFDAAWQMRLDMASPPLAAALRQAAPEELARIRAEALAWLEQYRHGSEYRLPSTALMVTAAR